MWQAHKIRKIPTGTTTAFPAVAKALLWLRGGRKDVEAQKATAGFAPWNDGFDVFEFAFGLEDGFTDAVAVPALGAAGRQECHPVRYGIVTLRYFPEIMTKYSPPCLRRSRSGLGIRVELRFRDWLKICFAGLFGGCMRTLRRYPPELLVVGSGLQNPPESFHPGAGFLQHRSVLNH